MPFSNISYPKQLFFFLAVASSPFSFSIICFNASISVKIISDGYAAPRFAGAGTGVGIGAAAAALYTI